MLPLTPRGKLALGAFVRSTPNFRQGRYVTLERRKTPPGASRRCSGLSNHVVNSGGRPPLRPSSISSDRLSSRQRLRARWYCSSPRSVLLGRLAGHAELTVLPISGLPGDRPPSRPGWQRPWGRANQFPASLPNFAPKLDVHLARLNHRRDLVRAWMRHDALNRGNGWLTLPPALI